MQNSRLNSDAVIYFAKLINHLYNLCETTLKKEFKSNIFDYVGLDFFIRPLHCDVACFTETMKPSTMCISNLAS